MVKWFILPKKIMYEQFCMISYFFMKDIFDKTLFNLFILTKFNIILIFYFSSEGDKVKTKVIKCFFSENKVKIKVINNYCGD